MDQQKTVADATSTITAAARTYAQDQVKNATAEKEDLKTALNKTLSTEQQAEIKSWNTEKQDAYYSANVTGYAAALANEKAVTKEWGMGGDSSRALNAVTIAITGALGGQTDVQTVSNALAPYAAQVIGEKFGHGEDKNTAAQLASHAILGAALAYVNGGDPTAGGSAAVASEAAADYLTNQYKDKKEYQDANGEFQPNLLPEDVKTQIRDLTAAIGAVVGGTVGDSAFEAQLAGVVGQNAVENNALENVLMPHEIDEIKNDTTGHYAKDQLQAIKDNSTYKINEDGDFIVCIKVASASCAPRVGERYATQQEILEKGGEVVATTAASWGATKVLEPIVVVASKSELWSKVTGTVKGWFGAKDETDSLMNSFTPAGDTVHHSSISTAVGDDKATVNNFKNVTDTGNGHNVIVHGQLKYDEIGGIPVINGKQTNMEQVAEAVRSNPDYVKGTPICLGSCWSGTSGTAEELANSLNVPVMAPTRPTAWDSKSKRWIMDTDVDDMEIKHIEVKPEWKMFYPKNKGAR